MKRTRVETAEIVEDLARRGIGVERVHREIAPRRVLAPVVGIGDDRVAAVGRDVTTQCRYLDRTCGGDGSNRAVREAGRNRLDPRILESLDHLLWRQARGNVDIGDVDPEQRVAHRTTDEARLALRRAENFRQCFEAVPFAPRRSREYQDHLRRRARLTIIAAVAPQIRRSFHMIS
jgi:hypothetical protein